MLSQDDVITLNQRVRFRAVGDDGVLVHMDRGKVIVINRTGLFIIKALQKGPQSLEFLTDQLVNQSNADKLVVLPDIQAYVEKLFSENVVDIQAA
jgi:hypothetical protein